MVFPAGISSTDRFDLRIDAQWVLPVEPAGILKAHTLLVRDGTIAGLHPTAELPPDLEAARHVRLMAHVLMPGLVNAHTHAAMTLFRGLADDTHLEAWLQEHVWPREAAHVAPGFVYDGTLLAAAEMLRGGTTCCSDMYFFPDDAARAFDQAGLRALVGMPVLDFPTSYAGDADAYLKRGFEARDLWRQHPRLRFALAPHAPYTVGDDTFSRIAVFANQLDVPIHTHVHETAKEVEESLARFGERPLERLRRLGIGGPELIAVHAVHLQPEDIEILARAQANAVHCPSSNLKLASGIAPVAALRKAGVNVALGTDGAASNNRLDMFEEMRLGALLAKARSGDAAELAAHDVLRMATLDGARALGLERQIGSLEIGKRADVIAVSLEDLDSLPCYDPTSHLVYVCSRRDVSHVWTDGECRIQDRQLVHLDAAELARNAGSWQERIQQ
jgi:5-methylthioadenosine/S-adenosylhomocysteine deaminase